MQRWVSAHQTPQQVTRSVAKSSWLPQMARWQSHQLKPHLTEAFKLSRDVRFLEKLTDVVGLYLNPPAKALVLRQAQWDHVRPHFIPTSSSWLNLVERWFGELTSKRRGVFHSVPDLVAAIEEFMERWNQNPKTFVWTATVESIVEKLQGCRQTLERIQPGITLPRSRKKRAKSRRK